MKNILTNRFNEIIARHMERLTGSARGEGGLPLTMATLGCLILLGTKETEIEKFSDNGTDRYTFQTLKDEAALFGIDSGETLEKHLSDMTDKGYLQVDSRDALVAGKPAMAMTGILDRIFPKMRGLNLLAYIGQTIEEAVTGRTALESAVSRLDQTLKHHGVPISSQANASTPARQQMDDRHGVRDATYENRRSRKEILAELYSRGQTSDNRPRSAGRSNRIIAGGAVLRSITADDIIRKERKPKTEEPIPAESVAKEGSQESVSPAAASPAVPRDQHEGCDEVEKKIDAGPGTAGGGFSAKFEPEPLPHAEAPCRDDEEDKELFQDTAEEAVEDQPPGEDAIARRIAAFEKDLALTCPMCKTTMLREQSTEAGKKYYTCPSGSCSFISWGKPHHVECSRCRNPFLIETSDASGNTILKCPRATCQHRQSLNPKVVKVVRKRVLRRRG